MDVAKVAEKTGLDPRVVKVVAAWTRYGVEGIQELLMPVRDPARVLTPEGQEAKDAVRLHLQTTPDHEAGQWGEMASVYVRGPKGDVYIGGFWNA